MKRNAVIHRCRLFKLAVDKKIDAGKIYHAQVWDTLQKPFAENKLPTGTVLSVRTGSSEPKLRSVMNGVQKHFGIKNVGFWTGHATVG